MKKWLYLTAAFAAVGMLSRLPHPARNVANLDPVQAVYLYLEGDALHIRTDTGDHGSGQNLTEAEANLRGLASKEVYLGTAEFLILHPEVPVAEDFFTLLSPSCRVCYAEEHPDLPAAARYLSTHTPDLRLAHLRETICPQETVIPAAQQISRFAADRGEFTRRK